MEVTVSLCLKWCVSYAKKQLESTPDTLGTAQRHAAYFYEYAQHEAKHLHTPNDAAALCHLEVEFDNLRAALTWAVTHDPTLCARLAPLLAQSLHLRGLWSEARQCLQQGWVTAARRYPPTANRCAPHYNITWPAWPMI